MDHQDQVSIQALCQFVKISRSGYYDWLHRKESARSKANRALSVAINASYAESDQAYGAIRVHRDLKDEGYSCSKNRVARLMRQAGIKSVHAKKYRPCTTDSKHKLPVAANLIGQDFSVTAPNRKWGGDITFIPTKEGWLYLAVVLDFYSRKVVGFAMQNSLQTSICSNALNMACLMRRPPTELIHHSDRGSQYASNEYRAVLAKHGFKQSMSRKGNCYDNAMVESFFSTLKKERVHRQKYQTKLQAKEDIKNYINKYNQKRRHSSLDYMSPNQYEQLNQIAA